MSTRYSAEHVIRRLEYGDHFYYGQMTFPSFFRTLPMMPGSSTMASRIS